MRLLSYARGRIRGAGERAESDHGLLSRLCSYALRRPYPQTHTYASFAPVLHYNALQGDLVGGAFWDMRATGLRLNSPLAEQAQGPPLDPDEMGMIDAALRGISRIRAALPGPG